MSHKLFSLVTVGDIELARDSVINIAGLIPENIKNMSWKEVSPEIRAVLERAQIGQVTDVTKVGDQSMMFILLRLGEPVQKSLDEARGEIENILKMPLAKERFEEYVNQLRNKAVIDVRM